MGLIRHCTEYRPNFALISYTDASFLDDVTEFAIPFDPKIYAAAKTRATRVMTADAALDRPSESKLAGGSECRYRPHRSRCTRVTVGAIPEDREPLGGNALAALKALVDEEQAANNPWKGIAITSDKGTERNVRPFEDYELAKLLKGLDSQPGHWRDLCVLALVTGARQEEIARLRDSDVFEHEGGYVLTMEKGKTDRMTKRIPVHHKSALPIIEKRSQLGGFLFPECKPTGEDQRRAKYFSKRFSEWKTKQGFGTELDFHSFRRYLANHFRKTVKDVHGVVPSAFLGHSIEDKDMTFGRYAGHVSVDELTPISEALRFPDGVEKALATLAVE